MTHLGKALDLSPKLSQRLHFLKHLQSEYDELEAKFFEESRAIADKYQELYQPLYAKRCDIVNGVVEVDGNEPAEQGEDKLAEDISEKGVPHFWLIAMKSNQLLAESIQEGDEEALKYLKDIKWCRVNVPRKDDNKKGEATKGFKLEFFFDPNPYFKNSVLIKTYEFLIDKDKQASIKKAIGKEIEWFPGECLAEKFLKKKPKGCKNAISFFNFFSPPELPEDDEEIEEEAVEKLQSLMEQYFHIGLVIRGTIIPDAVSWFIGKAVQDENEFAHLDLDDEVDSDSTSSSESDSDIYSDIYSDSSSSSGSSSDDDDDKTNSHEKGNEKPKRYALRKVDLKKYVLPPDERPPDCTQQ